MKVAITRVRNEEIILKSTLDRLSSLFDYVVAYDDCSTDGTKDVLSEHKLVKHTICNNTWESRSEVRKTLETTQRQELYNYTILNDKRIEWILYFDADEHFYFNNDIEWDKPYSYFFRLYDVYITKKDVNKNFIAREYIGCEYRDIPMLFKPNPHVKFYNRVPQNINIAMYGGDVKHFGKGISVEHWEETCNYYINHLNEKMPNGEDISDKWKRRKGKAIHTVSDFNYPLIKWKDRNTSKHVINLNKVDI